MWWDLLEKLLCGIDEEERIENFLKIYPEIDIRQIIKKVNIFNEIVKNRDVEKIDQSALLVDEILKENVRQAVERSKFLRKYSFRTISPFNKYIYILQDDTVKISMKYIRRQFRSKSYFSYHLIFKQFEHDWIIVETSLLYNLQWREWMNLFGWSITLFLIVVYNMK